MVQAIHVTPCCRGPGMQLPRRMWARAKECVVEKARAKGSRSVRFSLELPCCQSQQGPHFWIRRMGWDGTPEAREAADAWERGDSWKPDAYILWYEMAVCD